MLVFICHATTPFSNPLISFGIVGIVSAFLATFYRDMYTMATIHGRSRNVYGAKQGYVEAHLF